MQSERGLSELCLYFVFAVFLWCFVGCAPQEEAALQDQPNEANGIMIEEFTGLMNAHRESVGCQPLAARADLAAVAQGHSVDMNDREYFSHTDPSGMSPFDRMALANISFSAAGENIARVQGSGAEVLDAWLNSPGHRANIENCAFKQHGVGLENGYWTHMFMAD